MIVFQIPAAVHEAADTLALVLSFPFLGFLARMLWVMSEIKANLILTVKHLTETSADHEDRIRDLEKWDGKDRRTTHRRDHDA